MEAQNYSEGIVNPSELDRRARKPVWWARLDLNLSRLAGVSAAGPKHARFLRDGMQAGARWRNPEPEHRESARDLTPLNTILVWWARLDLNQEPTDYESAALTVELRAHC
jgi:hypothetical protein